MKLLGKLLCTLSVDLVLFSVSSGRNLQLISIEYYTILGCFDPHIAISVETFL